jgi:hypothetical protein
MKKILLLILIFISIKSFSQQPIDTVYVRNLSLRAEDWYWLKGGWNPSDSTAKKTWKKIRVKLVADNPASNTTMVTIDSIPGKIALLFYVNFLNASKGETSNMTNNISQNIKAYTPMLTFTNAVDLLFTNKFTNNRQNGKDDFNN